MKENGYLQRKRQMCSVRLEESKAFSGSWGRAVLEAVQVPWFTPEINIDYDKLGRTAASALVNAGVGFKCDQVVFARLIEDLIDYA